MHSFCLKYPYSDEPDHSGEEVSDDLGSELGSFGICGTGLGMLFCVVEFPVDVTLAGDDSSFNGVCVFVLRSADTFFHCGVVRFQPLMDTCHTL